MGHGPGPEVEQLPVHVTEDGRVFVNVGSRFVEASLDDLDVMLDRLATMGGMVVYSRDDPAEEPGPTALEVAAMVASHGVDLRLRDTPADAYSDPDL
jgi:hypothetical protein